MLIKITIILIRPPIFSDTTVIALPVPINQNTSNANTKARAPQLKAKFAILILAAAAASFLLWLSVVSNVQRTCAVPDTTGLVLCPADGTTDELTSLKRRVAANPGDTGAYVALLQSAPSADRAVLLRAASAVAPNDPNVLKARAALAIEQQRLRDAIPSLVQLTEYYRHFTNEPANTLARVIAGGQGHLLQQHLKPGNQWFAHVLGQMVALKLPLAAALPLVSQATTQGVLPQGHARSLVKQLKAEGSWVDAYGLWIGQHNGRVPILFNPGFDRDFEPDGFDWEVAPQRPGREGAIAQARQFPGRGEVLEILYTGRAMPTPVVRQYVFLAAGHYRLAGQYMTSKLRTESGLAWVVRCTADGAKDLIAGRTAALADTQGAWLPFQVDFTVPANCGPVASLQLETFAPYEATAGMRGRVHFDAFSLQQAPL